MPRGPKAEAEKAFDMLLGRRIELARKARGLRPKAVETGTAMCRGQLYTFESGMSTCSPYKLMKIAAVLGMSVSDLLPDTKVS